LDTTNAKFQEALRLVQFTRLPVFLTGRAGTGKSTFLKHVRETIKKKQVVLAPTGIAAINVGGVTIHSFFKIPLRPILPNDPELSLNDRRIFDYLKYTKAKIQLIRELELVIIDEISMVRCDTLDFIDQVLRAYSGNRSEPFGGKQLLLVGDAFQLEPVVKRDEWQILSRFYKTPFFFSAQAFQHLPLAQVELDKVYRQSDPHFVNILDKIRLKRAGKPELMTINNRLNHAFSPPAKELFITLATRRDTVDYINEQKLDELDGKVQAFEGTITGEFPESSLPTLKRLFLKPNAQVMFVKNDMERRWCNGTLGVVESIEENEIAVRLENDETYIVSREKWENLTYKFDEINNRVIAEEIGSFTQFPLRLAWAVTIHKSQGLTFDKVMIDLSGGTFACGQLYVALSRCRTLEGMVLKTPVLNSDIKVNHNVIAFSETSNNQELIEKEIRKSKADSAYLDALKMFRQRNWIEAINNLAVAIDYRNIISNGTVQRFISREMTILNHSQNRVAQLESELQELRDSVEDFAREYFLMANECQVKFADNRSAIANLNKAITLNPRFIDALLRRAGLLNETGDIKKAEEDCTSIINIKPRHPEALLLRAIIRLQDENNEAAYKDLLAVIEIDNTNIETYKLLSLLCYKMGEEENARKFKKIAKRLEKRKGY